MGDLELLSDYINRQSEAAFTTVVQRYAGLVYSAALRQVRDPHLAEQFTLRSLRFNPFQFQIANRSLRSLVTWLLSRAPSLPAIRHSITTMGQALRGLTMR